MNGELRRAMRPFRVRLAAEALIHAACVSGVVVLPVWLMLALLRQLLNMGGAWRPVWMASAWFLLFAALYIFRYRRKGDSRLL